MVFRKQADLAAIYGNLTRTAIHTIKPDNIATFLGRKLNVQYEGEVGNRFNIRIQGTRIKHTRGRYLSSSTTSSASFCASRRRSTI